MPQNDDTRFDDGLIGADGPEHPVRSASAVPWRLDEVRIDGIEGTLPAFRAGASATLSCVFLPADGAADHVERWQAVRRYRRYAGDVTTYQSQGQAYYREQHPEMDGRQLALLAPLDAEATGHDPLSRPSAFEALWVVITEVEDTTRLPQEVATLDIEVTMIARRAEYATRNVVRDAFERNGFGV